MGSHQLQVRPRADQTCRRRPQGRWKTVGIKPVGMVAPWNADCATRTMTFHTSALDFPGVENERITMDLLLTGKARVFALATCALLTCGCQSGVNSSVAPSAISSVSASTGSDSTVVMPGDVITMQDAPVSYAIDEVISTSGSSSGYSGTCTVSNTHTGAIRVKVDGVGAAYSLIRFDVVDVSDPDLQRDGRYVDVNQQGSFRTNWRAIDAGVFPAGHDLQCWLTSSVNLSTLAKSSSTFPAP